MRKTAFFVLALAVMLVGACNTMRGIGRDVQAAGRGLENLSTDAENSMTGSNRSN
jgi:predicted small secreted protein